MKNFIQKTTGLLFALILLTGSLVVPAEANTDPVRKKPTVVLIKAEWCGACKKVDPIIRGLMREYRGKINFVVLDVTDEAAEARSAKRAKSLGLAGFFDANKRKTSTVGVFNGTAKVFQTYKNYDRSAYVKAFEKALK